MAPPDKSAFPLPQFTRGGSPIGYDALTELHNRVEGLEAGGVEGGSLAARVTALEEQSEQLTPNLGPMVEENTEGISAHDQEIAAQNAKIDQNSADIDANAASIANLNNDLAFMFNRLNALEAQVQTNVNNLNNIGDRVTALESSSHQHGGKTLTGFSPKDVPNGLQHTVTGTGLTDPWGAGEEYLLAFSPTGGDGEPTGWRVFAGGWSATELTTAFLGKSHVDSAGSVGSDYDCFLIKGDDQGDPIQPFVVLSNVLVSAVTLAADPE